MSEQSAPGESGSDMVMSSAERSKSSVLIIDTDPMNRSTMRAALRTLGYGGVSDAPNHKAGLDKMEGRHFTHIVFDAKGTNIPAKDFLDKVLEAGDDIVAIPSSFDPNVDDVFDMLIKGAKGFLVKPFTIDTIENAITNATKGEPIADAVKQASDRNEALVAIMMASLDKLATIMRQAQQFETAKREIPKAMLSFRRSAELAKTFAKEGDEGLLIAMETFCIERSQGPASRLGRLRKRLKKGRVV